MGHLKELLQLKSLPAARVITSRKLIFAVKLCFMFQGCLYCSFYRSKEVTVICLLILMYVCYFSLFVFLLKSCFSVAKLENTFNNRSYQFPRTSRFICFGLFIRLTLTNQFPDRKLHANPADMVSPLLECVLHFPVNVSNTSGSFHYDLPLSWVKSVSSVRSPGRRNKT